MAVLGESIPWNMWIGIGLILLASLISMIPTLHTLASLIPLLSRRFHYERHS
jgi:drug/metabolite transporter (DMT)-like permease